MTSAIDPASVPSELRDSLDRHQRNVMALVASLRSAGLGEDVIERSVQQILASYQAELVLAIHTLMRTDIHA